MLFLDIISGSRCKSAVYVGPIFFCPTINKLSSSCSVALNIRKKPGHFTKAIASHLLSSHAYKELRVRFCRLICIESLCGLDSSSVCIIIGKQGYASLDSVPFSHTIYGFCASAAE